jgi:fatty-acyl-CoA synthase
MTSKRNDRFALRAWIRALDAMRQLEDGAEHTTLMSIVRNVAERYGDRPALIDDLGIVTYAMLVDRCNSYARWAQMLGIRAGDVVCLMMPNCAEYAAIWLGLTDVGCTVALINTGLVGSALAHSFKVAAPTHAIVARSFQTVVTDALGEDLRQCCIWVHGGRDGDLSLIDRSTLSPDSALPIGGVSSTSSNADRALLIYTSGTTGLPKAANVTHGRIVEWSYWFAAMMDAGPDDRMYDCLPMYHSTGGIVAIGSMLVRGGSVLISQRFSASRFWDDVSESGCTIFQYIGEICRFLLRSPPHPRERQHSLRLCCGNGMSGEVWRAFEQRFAIPRILEFYAATEGCVSLYNCEGQPGAIGRIPPYLANRFPVALIRCDPDSGNPIRDSSGHCIPCAPDEVGQAIGKLESASSAAARHFHGYTDPSASASKVIRNVFVPDDSWFGTGDLMRKDVAGFFYFVDRLGDTFRWKGENVASTEVAETIGTCHGVVAAVVFGQKIPGTEGRAGMAAIVTEAGFSFDMLRAHLKKNLPIYAQPLFVRICQNLEMTGTFKLSKARLAAEGYRADRIGDDSMWFNDHAHDVFIPCDAGIIGRIESGEIAL